MQSTQQNSTKSRLGQTAGKLAVMIMLILCLVSRSSRAAAQSTGITWSASENLSNTPQSSSNPAVIADNYGNVHVFWSEEADGKPLASSDLAGSGNTIYYTRWDGSQWTQPIDIVTLPDDPIADQISATVDKQGFLHLVWTGLSNIYYSKAHVTRAGSAQAWLKPVVIATNSARSSLESSTAVDNAGYVHILYATRGSDAGVYHVQSVDGDTWSDPYKLSEPYDSLETSFSRVKVIVDGAGRLHAVWQTTDEIGAGHAIYYARSTDQGETWTAPLRMAYRNPDDFDVGWPYIMAVGKSELHLIHTGGSTIGAAGRYEHVSLNGGETWSEPQHIITEMIGINGYVVPVVDATGQLHLIIDMRPLATQEVGIYYSRWIGDRWSPVVPLVVNTPAAESAHYTAVAVAHGNEIHIVWNQIRGGEIWHLRGVIQNVAPTKIETVPAIVTAPTPEPTAAVVSVRRAQSVSVTINSELTTTALNSASSSPLIPGVIAVLVLVTVVVVGRLYMAQRRSSHRRSQ